MLLVRRINVLNSINISPKQVNKKISLSNYKISVEIEFEM